MSKLIFALPCSDPLGLQRGFTFFSALLNLDSCCAGGATNGVGDGMSPEGGMYTGDPGSDTPRLPPPPPPKPLPPPKLPGGPPKLLGGPPKLLGGPPKLLGGAPPP